MLNPYYIAGLVEGDGYFGVNVHKLDSMAIGYQVTLSFGIDMDSRELELLQRIKKHLRCGNIHIGKSGKVQYRVRSFSDIYKKIIPFFDKYKMEGGKIKDFEIFKIIAELMKERKHVTQEGFDRIRLMRKGLHIYNRTGVK